MSEPCQQGLPCGPEDLRSALSIHTKKITDSCRDKDFIEDLRVYLTRESQAILNTAANAKVRSAELVYTAIDVTPVSFNRNHYCIDLTFYYRILADAMVGTCRPSTVCGLAMFSKRAVLCGENATAHIFRSDNPLAILGTGSMPTAVVEVLDPMVLSSKIAPVTTQESGCVSLPAPLQGLFDDELPLGGDKQRLLVTLGQFSLIRLERDAQLVVPVLDYFVPTKQCCDNPGCAEDPCQVFARIPFPTPSFSGQCPCEESSG